MKTILLASANGCLDNFLVKALLKQGFRIKVILLDGEHNRLLEDKSLRISPEVSFTNQIPSSFQGIELVISTLFFFRLDQIPAYRSTWLRLSLQLLEVAQREENLRMLCLSRDNIFKTKDLNIIRDQRVFHKQLGASGLDYTILRPTIFFSELVLFFKDIQSGHIILPNYGQNRINPLHMEEFTNICVHNIYSRQQEKNIGGGEVLSYWQIMNMLFEYTQMPPQVHYRPYFLLFWQSFVKGLWASDKKRAQLISKIRLLATDTIGKPMGKTNLRQFLFSEEDRQCELTAKPGKISEQSPATK
jgi:hypothetical protein